MSELKLAKDDFGGPPKISQGAVGLLDGRTSSINNHLNHRSKSNRGAEDEESDRTRAEPFCV